MAEAAPHIEEEKVVGEAEILQTFPLKERRGHEVGLIAGCRVEIGSLVQASTFRVLRSGKQLWQGQCSSIRRHKLEVHQIGKVSSVSVLVLQSSGLTIICIARPANLDGFFASSLNCLYFQFIGNQEFRVLGMQKTLHILHIKFGQCSSGWNRLQTWFSCSWVMYKVLQGSK